MSQATAKAENFKQLKWYDQERSESIPLNALDEIKKSTPRYREEFIQTGMPKAVHQFLCSVAPYPTKYGFHTHYTGLNPFLFFNNRATLVQFEVEGETKNFLFNPYFPDLSLKAPFYANLVEQKPFFVPESLLGKKEESILDQLASVGLTPDDIDYVSYDHLHVQDMRPLMGVVNENGEVIQEGYFKNAKFIFHEKEWESVEFLHPINAQWYVQNGVKSVDKSKLLLYTGDLLLGPGIALIHTPGHTAGNHSLYLNTPEGTFTISENSVGPDGYNPENSKMADLRNAAANLGIEVILNANTLDFIFDQYNSCIKEKLLSGPAPKNPDFCNHRSSSQFTSFITAPGLNPTYEHDPINYGKFK